MANDTLVQLQQLNLVQKVTEGEEWNEGKPNGRGYDRKTRGKHVDGRHGG